VYPKTFPEKIPDASDISKAAQFDRRDKHSTIKKKYGDFHRYYFSMTKEILDRAN
jgi:hypothetical protein